MLENSKHFVTRVLIIPIVLAIIFTSVSASEKNPNQSTEGPVDKTHRVISKSVIDTANWIDSFFGERRADIENTKSHARFRISGLFEDGSDPSGKFRMRIAVDLREFRKLTSDKLQLILGGQQDTTNDTDTPAAERTIGDNDNDFGVGLQAFLKSTKKTNIALQTGVRVTGPAWFIGPRARFTFKPLKPWALRFTQVLRWSTDRNGESRTRLDFERPIKKRFFFRTSAAGSYREDKYDTDGYRYNVQTVLFHPIGKRRALSYGVTLDFRTKPNNHLRNRSLGVRYRQRLWKDWLFFDVEPSISFPKERDEKFTPAILFQLETYIGGALSYKRKVEALPKEQRLPDSLLEEYEYENESPESSDIRKPAD